MDGLALINQSDYFDYNQFLFPSFQIICHLTNHIILIQYTYTLHIICEKENNLLEKYLVVPKVFSIDIVNF